MIKLQSVYRHDDSIKTLYELLKERDLRHGISHKELPEFDKHRQFVLSNPYQCWYLILHDDRPVGSIYLSKQREIGVFVFKSEQGNGYATQGVELLMKRWPGRFLANIQPDNEASKRFFERLGFKRIQETYAL